MKKTKLSITEIVASQLEEELSVDGVTMFKVATDAGCKVNSLRRLLRSRDATLSTVENLLAYFQRPVAELVDEFSFRHAVDVCLARDGSLNENQKKFLSTSINLDYTLAKELF